MSSQTTFRNNGSATVSQEYTASRTVKEISEIQRVKSMTTMNSVSVSKTVQTSVSVGWFFVKSKMTTSLTEAYSYSVSQSSSESEKFTREEETLFTASQKLEIPSCNEYTVNSYVKVVQGMPVDYNLFSYVRGSRGRRVMNATEIKETLSGMEYVEDYDNFTIIAKSSGSMVVTLV